MEAEALRTLQAPLKARYRDEPAAALITLRAEGSVDDANIACKVETGRALVTAGLHPATGGTGLEALFPKPIATPRAEVPARVSSRANPSRSQKSRIRPRAEPPLTAVRGTMRSMVTSAWRDAPPPPSVGSWWQGNLMNGNSIYGANQ